MMLSPAEPAAYPRLVALERPVHAPGAVIVWPRVAWEVEPYQAALRSMSTLHSDWWQHTGVPGPWLPLDIIYEPGQAIREACDALDSLERSRWAHRFLSTEQIGALRGVLADPEPLLSVLRSVPRTLISRGSEPGCVEDLHAECQAGAAVGIGPAAYDLAAFYSSSRWQFGRTPLSMGSTRAAYLRHLNSLLPEPVDRCVFDIAFDAALAWRFVALWTKALAERPACLLARAHHLQATVVEPAFASLRRTL